MKKNILILFILLLLSSCVGSSSGGVFGTGVSVALDPRTLGTQIDDSIMQKNLIARLALTEKKYLVSVTVKVLDGRIFLGGKVEEAEEKLFITLNNAYYKKSLMKIIYILLYDRFIQN